MPAEWSPHAATYMGWPCRTEIWNGREAAAKEAYAEVARAIARFEPVVMLANPDDVAAAGAACGPGITIEPIPLDDSWLRDIGPSFLADITGRIAAADWRFNAWGRKWPDFARDDALAGTLAARLGMRCYAADFVLEGGSIHVDGAGTLLTSEQCLMNANRNPGLDRAAIEGNLKDWLGVRQIVWLGQGLENDGTDGHIDNLACFARPGVVLAASCDDPGDANHAVLADNLARLRAARDAEGAGFEIIELPIPARRDTAAGRLALSYVNFYLANGAVIAPAFDDTMDDVAARLLSEAFPGRALVQVPALAILEGGGGIHCITQQLPAGPRCGKDEP